MNEGDVLKEDVLLKRQINDHQHRINKLNRRVEALELIFGICFFCTIVYVIIRILSEVF